MRILLVEDEKRMAQALCQLLRLEQYDVDHYANGIDGLIAIESDIYDIIILDVMLPGKNGFDIAKEARNKGIKTPILMLTAKSELDDKVTGLDCGADDYLTKPFNILELKARIKAILRRAATNQPEDAKNKQLEAKGIVLDYNSRKLKMDNRVVELTAKEFDLLDLFMSNLGRVYSREQLLDIVWGYDYPGDIRTVDVHVRRLREKIEPNPAEPIYIMTKWGVGYYFSE